MSRYIPLLCGAVALAACAAFPAAAADSSAAQPQQGPTQLGTNTAYYPTAIRLEHSGTANGRILAADNEGASGAADRAHIFESTDDGRTFHPIATIDPRARSGVCCSVVYELPRQVGDLPTGTLLWAATQDWQRQAGNPMSIAIWQSRDHGRAWSPLSTCFAPGDDDGTWEPELSVDAAGDLDCYFSDEPALPQRSRQLLSRTVSRDGVHWGPKEDIVALPAADERPGMVAIRPLPTGQYVMTYERCHAEPQPGDCQVYSRLSPDGQNWGDSTWPGTPITDASGAYPAHAPKTTVLGNGRIVLVAQEYDRPDRTQDPRTGHVVVISDGPQAGSWSPIPAPVPIPDVGKPGGCANYSSALVPVGTGVLEIATDNNAGTCRAYYATGPGE